MLTPEALPVLAAITLERDRQLTDLGWTPEHDDDSGVWHLIEQAETHLYHLHPLGESRSDRVELVKAAALLVAAIEVLDRTDQPC